MHLPSMVTARLRSDQILSSGPNTSRPLRPFYRHRRVVGADEEVAGAVAADEEEDRVAHLLRLLKRRLRQSVDRSQEQ